MKITYKGGGGNNVVLSVDNASSASTTSSSSTTPGSSTLKPNTLLNVNSENSQPKSSANQPSNSKKINSSNTGLILKVGFSVVFVLIGIIVILTALGIWNPKNSFEKIFNWIKGRFGKRTTQSKQI